MKKVIVAIIVVIIIIGLIIGTHAQSAPYYLSAVRWAWEQGITKGTTAATFSPDRHITRAEAVTLLWRMAGSPEPSGVSPFSDVEPDPTPTPTPRIIPQPPEPRPTIHPDFSLDYYGRMYIGDVYSVGLYDTMSQNLVDLTDAAFIAKFAGGCRMIGDHDSEGLWLIRWLEPGDNMRIVHKDGTTETFVLLRTDPHVSNIGYDVIDADGNSCIYTDAHDVMISTCNDSTGRDMTATFWARTDGPETGAQIEAAPDVSIPRFGGITP